MAADDVNARGGVLGGRKIELVTEDDSGTPEKGVAGFRKLATLDQVVAVVGQVHSSVMGGGPELAEQFKIPLFATPAAARSPPQEPPTPTVRTPGIDADPASPLD